MSRTLHETLRALASAAIRERLHPDLLDALSPQADDDAMGDLNRVEDAVIAAISDPAIGWALAYLAGVTMATDLSRAAQARPAQPPANGVG